MESAESVDLDRGRRMLLRSVPLLLTVPVLAQAHSAWAAAPGRVTQKDVSQDAFDNVGTPLDAERMRSLAAFTMQSMQTAHPIPYGAEIFATKGGQTNSGQTKGGDPKTGKSLMRALNAVGPEHDPSAHGEVRTIRLACKKLQSPSLLGYTLYTTCEPCPMCMACCLWAGLDRVVYGATIADAAKHGHQIMISAAEVQRRGDMPCEVIGPVERAACLQLFTNSAMQAVFATWKERG